MDRRRLSVGILAVMAGVGIAIPSAEAVTASQLQGKTIYFSGGSGSATFGADGSYTYQGQGARRSGTYTISGSTIRIRFRDGGSRRDTILPGQILKDQHGQQYQFTIR